MMSSSPSFRLQSSIWSTFLLMALCCGCTYLKPKAGHSGFALPDLMVQRLSWMDEVAAIKQARALPITDAKREAELLAVMTKLGVQAGLPLSSVRAFFTGQMEAAKLYQHEWLKRMYGPKGKNVPDLNTVIRPALDANGRQMIDALAAAKSHPDSTQIVEEARRKLHRAGYSNDVTSAAVQGLADALRLLR